MIVTSSCPVCVRQTADTALLEWGLLPCGLQHTSGAPPLPPPPTSMILIKKDGTRWADPRCQVLEKEGEHNRTQLLERLKLRPPWTRHLIGRICSGFWLTYIILHYYTVPAWIQINSKNNSTKAWSLMTLSICPYLTRLLILLLFLKVIIGKQSDLWEISD